MSFYIPFVELSTARINALALASRGLNDDEKTKAASYTAYYLYHTAKCENVFTAEANDFANLMMEIDVKYWHKMYQFAQRFHIDTLIVDLKEQLGGERTAKDDYAEALMALKKDLEVFDADEKLSIYNFYVDYHSRGILVEGFNPPAPVFSKDSTVWRFVELYIEKASQECAKITDNLLNGSSNVDGGYVSA